MIRKGLNVILLIKYTPLYIRENYSHLSSMHMSPLIHWLVKYASVSKSIIVKSEFQIIPLLRNVCIFFVTKIQNYKLYKTLLNLSRKKYTVIEHITTLKQECKLEITCDCWHRFIVHSTSTPRIVFCLL